MTEPPSSDGPLQFGRREPGVAYRDRAAAYGVAGRGDGRIACVRVTRGAEPPYIDLPGGALDAGEDDPAALVREFGEETGLIVTPARLLVRAFQLMRMEDDEPVNNRSALFEVTPAGEDPSLKIEHDHQLVWLEPLEAVRRLRHDSHAYAVAAWLRAGA